MAYFDYPQLQILEQMMDRYKEAFPDCDLTKIAENIGLKEAFRKDEYFETMREDVLDRIHEGFRSETEFSDEAIDIITHRALNWMDYSFISEAIDEILLDYLSESKHQTNENTEEEL